MIYRNAYKKNKNTIYTIIKVSLILCLFIWCAFAYFGYQTPSVKVSKVINIQEI